MMISPQVAPADVGSAYALIALITDPQAAKTRLDELVKAQADANAAIDDATAVQTQAVADQATAEAAMADVARAKEELDTKYRDQAALFNAHSDALERREAGLRAAQGQLDEDRKQHQQKVTADFAASATWDKWKAEEEKRLADETATLAAREKDIDAREASANALIAEYQNKLTALKKIAE